MLCILSRHKRGKVAMILIVKLIKIGYNNHVKDLSDNLQAIFVIYSNSIIDATSRKS